MSNAVLSLILDITILISLGGTIYYAFRLTNALGNFQKHRQDMQGLIADLNDNIEKAVMATESLKRTSESEGAKLQSVIDSARGLSEELQEMNDVGNSMASRLERLAAQNSTLAQGRHEGRSDTRVHRDELETLFRRDDSGDADDLPFTIQDRALEDVDFGDDDADWLSREGGDTLDDLRDDLQSEAERDLYRALQKKKTAGGSR